VQAANRVVTAPEELI